MAEWRLGHDSLVSDIVFAVYAGLPIDAFNNAHETA